MYVCNYVIGPFYCVHFVMILSLHTTLFKCTLFVFCAQYLLSTLYGRMFCLNTVKITVVSLCVVVALVDSARAVTLAHPQTTWQPPLVTSSNSSSTTVTLTTTPPRWSWQHSMSRRSVSNSSCSEPISCGNNCGNSRGNSRQTR